MHVVEHRKGPVEHLHAVSCDLPAIPNMTACATLACCRSSLPVMPQPAAAPISSLAAVQKTHAADSGRYSQSAARLAAQLAVTPPEMQRLVSLAHLEHQMAAALELRAADEYQQWLKLYANALAQQLAIRQVGQLLVLRRLIVLA